jgi:hypothetical protein
MYLYIKIIPYLLLAILKSPILKLYWNASISNQNKILKFQNSYGLLPGFFYY